MYPPHPTPALPPSGGGGGLRGKRYFAGKPNILWHWALTEKGQLCARQGDTPCNVNVPMILLLAETVLYQRAARKTMIGPNNKTLSGSVSAVQRPSLRVDHSPKWTTLMRVVHIGKWSTLTHRRLEEGSERARITQQNRGKFRPSPPRFEEADSQRPVTPLDFCPDEMYSPDPGVFESLGAANAKWPSADRCHHFLIERVDLCTLPRSAKDIAGLDFIVLGGLGFRV